MNIIVCFQVVPDLTAARDENFIENTRCCVSGCLPRVFDCYDEGALELALKLRDSAAASGIRGSLHAVTIESSDGDDRFYERLFAVSYDTVTRISRSGITSFTPRAKASLLSRHVLSGAEPDIILFGMRSSQGGSGQTGVAVSELLGLPCLTSVSAVTSAGEGRLDVTLNHEGAVSHCTVNGRIALLVGNSENGLLRVPTLKAKLAVKNKKANCIICEDSAAGNIEPVPMSAVRKTKPPPCAFIEGTKKQQTAAIMDAFTEVMR